MTFMVVGLRKLILIADERERSSLIPELLKEMGVEVRFKQLTVGDYIVSDGRAVERKEVYDFINSLYSGRLFDQAGRLAEAYPEPIIIVEGSLNEALSLRKNPRAIWGALARLSLDLGLSIFHTPSKEQTAQLLHTLAAQEQLERGKRPAVRKKPRLSTIKGRQLHIVQGLPRIGPILAERLLKELGTVRRVFKASNIELSRVKGVGRQRAMEIAHILDAPYSKGKAEERLMKLALNNHN